MLTTAILDGTRRAFVRFSIARKNKAKVGYKATAENIVGKIKKAEYVVYGIPNAPAKTRFVGFEETRRAEARFTAENWANVQAVGGEMLSK